MNVQRDFTLIDLSVVFTITRLNKRQKITPIVTRVMNRTVMQLLITWTTSFSKRTFKIDEDETCQESKQDEGILLSFVTSVGTYLSFSLSLSGSRSRSINATFAFRFFHFYLSNSTIIQLGRLHNHCRNYLLGRTANIILVLSATYAHAEM